MPIRVSPRARRQLRELADWWKHNRRASRTLVDTEFERVLSRLSEKAHVGSIYPSDDRYRTIALQGTPYLVYYFINEAKGLIEIDAVWSAQRGKGPELK